MILRQGTLQTCCRCQPPRHATCRRAQEAWLRFQREAAPAVDDGASGAPLEPWVAEGMEQLSKHLEAQARILDYAQVLDRQGDHRAAACLRAGLVACASAFVACRPNS